MAGELYVDGCPLTPEVLRTLARIEWRGAREGTREVKVRKVRAADTRLLVHFDGLATREQAQPYTNGTLWADTSELPDPGPGVSYAFQLTGMRVVDVSGRELGVVAEVVFNVGQPLLQLEGAKGALLPCQPPFMKSVDMVGRVITLELPAGFEEL